MMSKGLQIRTERRGNVIVAVNHNNGDWMGEGLSEDEAVGMAVTAELINNGKCVITKIITGRVGNDGGD